MANPAIISTYTLLRNAIEDHMNRSDIDDEGVSAMVVDLAEARLNRETMWHPSRLIRDDAFTVDSQYEDVPTGFYSVKRFALNTSPVQHLEYVTPDRMADFRQRQTASGRPIYYTVSGATAGGESFEFFPTPDSSYTGLLLYVQAIPALASNASNWLLAAHPDIYLQASLVGAHLWAQDNAQADVWEARYLRSLDALRVSGERRAHGSTPIVRPSRSFG